MGDYEKTVSVSVDSETADILARTGRQLTEAVQHAVELERERIVAETAVDSDEELAGDIRRSVMLNSGVLAELKGVNVSALCRLALLKKRNRIRNLRNANGS